MAASNVERASGRDFGDLARYPSPRLSIGLAETFQGRKKQAGWIIFWATAYRSRCGAPCWRGRLAAGLGWKGTAYLEKGGGGRSTRGGPASRPTRTSPSPPIFRRHALGRSRARRTG